MISLSLSNVTASDPVLILASSDRSDHENVDLKQKDI